MKNANNAALTTHTRDVTIKYDYDAMRNSPQHYDIRMTEEDAAQ